MTLRDRLALIALLLLSWAEPARAQSELPAAEEASLMAAHGGPGDRVGYSVAVSADGGRAIVGAIGDDTPAGRDSGSARVFVRTAATWSEEATLVGSGASGGDHAGAAVAIASDGTRVAIGAPLDDTTAGDDAGSVRVFVCSGSSWTEEAVLAPSDAASGAHFGTAISLSADGRRLLVGSPQDDAPEGDDAGSARVFVRDDRGWSEEATLRATPTGARRDQLGISVSISADGSRALVGAHGRDTAAGQDAGSARVFVRVGSEWTHEALLVASDARAGDQLGVSVSISADGSRALVGADGDDTDAGDDAGSARVFVRSGNAWSEEATLLASDGASRDLLGISVSLSADGSRALAGVSGDDTAYGSNTGSARVFTRMGTAWREVSTLLASEGAAADELGLSVALTSDGRRCIVGAHAEHNASGEYAGSARVFTLATDAPGAAVARRADARTDPDAIDVVDLGTLRSIDGEATAAWALYGVSLAAFVGGGVASLVGSNWLTGHSDGVAVGVGLGLAGLGLVVLLPLAIGLDVDAHSRRSALGRRDHSELRLAPGPGDIGLALALTL